MIGLVLIATGGALACVPPVQRIVAHQRLLRALTYGAALRSAVPLAPADPELEALVALID